MTSKRRSNTQVDLGLTGANAVFTLLLVGLAYLFLMGWHENLALGVSYFLCFLYNGVGSFMGWEVASIAMVAYTIKLIIYALPVTLGILSWKVSS